MTDTPIRDKALIQIPHDQDEELGKTKQHLVKKKQRLVKFSNDTHDSGDGEHITENSHLGLSEPTMIPEESAVIYSKGSPWIEGSWSGATSSNRFKHHNGHNGILRSQATTGQIEGPFGRMIRDSMVYTREPTGGHVFLPKNKLDELLTEERVFQVLANIRPALPECLKKITKAIVGIMEVIDSRENSTELKKIFTILVLIEKVETIVDFIDEGLNDSDLPFQFRGDNSGQKFPNRRQLQRKDGEDKFRPISLFMGWEDKDVEAFEGQQWKIEIPLFSTVDLNSAKPPHYNLASGTILPFQEVKEIGTGGFSAVHKVYIHPSHHGFPSDTKKPYYAVKKLRHSDSEAFAKEVSNLNRFVVKGHPNLIKLLWTYSCRDDYHLVFPCADGNLMDFWKRQDGTLAEKRSHCGALWFASQCLGIVEGLHMIHQDDNGGSPKPRKKRHGRHGDLKPENILWFRNTDEQQGCYNLGVLKISDFGLTRFHGTRSRSRVYAGGVGMSPTYRAPEYDVFQEVSQSYDIWSLACVLLEFVTWYLLGWEEVDKFSRSRTDEDQHPDIERDTFFNYARVQSSDGNIRGTAAQAKQSVADEFQTLYEHKDASDFTVDLLRFIETKLLRMCPEKRSCCSDTYRALKIIYQYCQDNPSYCLNRMEKIPLRRDTNLSVLTPWFVDRPPAMQKLAQRSSQGDFTQYHESPSRFIQPNRRSGSESPRRRPPSSVASRMLVEEPQTYENSNDNSTSLNGHAGGRILSQAATQGQAVGGSVDENSLSTPAQSSHLGRHQTSVESPPPHSSNAGVSSSLPPSSVTSGSRLTVAENLHHKDDNGQAQKDQFHPYDGETHQSTSNMASMSSTRVHPAPRRGIGLSKWLQKHLLCGLRAR